MARIRHDSPGVRKVGDLRMENCEILTPDEESRLGRISRGREPGDQDEARGKLVSHNFRLVAKLANIAADADNPADDLFQEGVLGLMRAAEEFDPDKGRFTTFACYWINHHIKDYKYNLCLYRIPIYIKAYSFGYVVAQDHNLQEFGAAPDAEQVRVRMLAYVAARESGRVERRAVKRKGRKPPLIPYAECESLAAWYAEAHPKKYEKAVEHIETYLRYGGVSVGSMNMKPGQKSESPEAWANEPETEGDHVAEYDEREFHERVMKVIRSGVVGVKPRDMSMFINCYTSAGKKGRGPTLSQVGARFGISREAARKRIVATAEAIRREIERREIA